ncbi:MAG: FAD-dependent oxidoreductase [Micromonosporaceae bacterium]
MRVTVIGAGVVGLSCAVRLAEAGYQVGVLARDLPLETTSAVAAAIWYPYLISPPERVAAWSAYTYQELAKLAEAEPSITLRSGRELMPAAAPDPWWSDAVPDLRRITPPAGFADGWAFTAPVVEMPRYLPYLVGRLTAAGGTLTRTTLTELPNSAPVLVNCTGLGARFLADDASLTPVRGQVVYLRQPGITEWLLAERGGLIYVVPREHDVVVGGTSEPGEWSTRPDPEAAAAILARAVTLVPALADAPVLRHRAGLRPARPAIRCEARQAGSRVTVHCYGHGGAGVTVSWGCAEEVLRYVRTAVPI